MASRCQAYQPRATRKLPSSAEPTFYDNKIDDVLAHLQAARAGLVGIAHTIQLERGS
ncbi:MAG: hypothetical protein H0U45_16305 [Tatlockia sp.]|nr:hypothetical protein [Tatlockia sp.]